MHHQLLRSRYTEVLHRKEGRFVKKHQTFEVSG